MGCAVARGWQTSPRRYLLFYRDGLDLVFGHAASSSAATSSGRGMGMAGDAPFTDLSDLGVDMRLGGKFSASESGGGVEPGVERATMEVVEELVSDAEESSDSRVDKRFDPGVERMTGEMVAELLAEGEQALEEQRAATRARRQEDSAEELANKFDWETCDAWESFIDSQAEPTPRFDFVEYLRENPYVRPERTREKYRRALGSDWPVNAYTRRRSVTEADLEA